MSAGDKDEAKELTILNERYWKRRAKIDDLMSMRSLQGAGVGWTGHATREIKKIELAPTARKTCAHWEGQAICKDRKSPIKEVAGKLDIKIETGTGIEDCDCRQLGHNTAKED